MHVCYTVLQEGRTTEYNLGGLVRSLVRALCRNDHLR